MVKLYKYDKGRLLELFKTYDQKIYLSFYDLDYESFRTTIDKLDKHLNIIGTKVITIKNSYYLVVFGSPIADNILELINELDNIDSDFAVSEFHNLDEANILKTHIDKMKSSNRELYVSKYEGIIQAYNILA